MPEFDEIKLIRSTSDDDGKFTTFSIDSKNNISASISNSDGGMVNITFSSDGFINMYAKHGITLSTKNNSFSV